MKTELDCGVQDVGAGPDHGGGSEPPNFRSQIADCRLQARRTATGACRKEEGTMQNEAAVAAEASARCLSAFLALEWGNIRLCSLFGSKMFEALPLISRIWSLGPGSPPGLLLGRRLPPHKPRFSGARATGWRTVEWIWALGRH